MWWSGAGDIHEVILSLSFSPFLGGGLLANAYQYCCTYLHHPSAHIQYFTQFRACSEVFKYAHVPTRKRATNYENKFSGLGLHLDQVCPVQAKPKPKPAPSRDLTTGCSFDETPCHGFAVDVGKDLVLRA